MLSIVCNFSTEKIMSVVASEDARSWLRLLSVVFLPVSSVGMVPTVMCTYSK